MDFNLSTNAATVAFLVNAIFDAKAMPNELDLLLSMHRGTGDLYLCHSNYGPMHNRVVAIRTLKMERDHNTQQECIRVVFGTTTAIREEVQHGVWDGFSKDMMREQPIVYTKPRPGATNQKTLVRRAFKLAREYINTGLLPKTF